MEDKDLLIAYSVRKCGAFHETDSKVWRHKNMIEFAEFFLKSKIDSIINREDYYSLDKHDITNLLKKLNN